MFQAIDDQQTTTDKRRRKMPSVTAEKDHEFMEVIDTPGLEQVEMDIDRPLPSIDADQALEFHNYHSKAFVETEDSVPATIQHEVELEIFNDEGCSNCKSKIDDYKAEIALLRAQLATERQQRCIKHEKEISLLKSQLEGQVASNKTLASTVEMLSAPWYDDEIKKLGLPRDCKSHKWSEKSLAKHIRIYYKVGTTAYQFLLDEGFPFASIRTIQRHVSGISVEPGILHDFVHMMRPKVESMAPQERFCSIAIDEMAIQAKRDFDLSSQAFIGHPTISAGPKLTNKRLSKGDDPDEILATHGLNFLLCGLSTKWTQLIAYEFSDQSIDPVAMRDLIHGIVRVLFEIGLTVVNITTDMATDNVAL